MKCPKCNEQSIIMNQCQTLAYFMPFFDNDDNKHIHDNNIRHTDYKCKNNHKFTITSGTSPCPVKNCEFKMKEQSIEMRD